MGTSTAGGRRVPGRWAAAGIATLVLVVVACLAALAPSSPRGVDAPAGEFRAGRALAHVEALAAAPRPPGSPGHARAREYLLAELAALGWQVEVQQAVGLAHGPAPAAPLAPPDVTVVSDIPREGVRELTLRLSSPRRAPTLGLYVDAATPVRRAVVAGRDVPVHGPWRSWSFDFLFHGAPADGVTVRLELEPAAPAALRVADRSDDLAAAPGLPAGRVLTNPQSVVTRRVVLP